jgi:tripartite ATP-independent transporter DctM subunit
MDPVLAGLAAILGMLILVAAGVPVAIALMTVSVFGMWGYAGISFLFVNFETLPYAISSEFAFLVIPMFVFMGALTASSGVTAELYNAGYRWTSGFRGSLYYATTLASGAFAAINGSTVVSSLIFTRIALPEMLRFGYHPGLSAGAICAAGTFAAMIPPSVVMVLYAILTETSVGKLLIAGVLPGLLTVFCYIVGIGILLHVRPDYAPKLTQRFSLREKLASTGGLWPVIILFGIVFGGIYSGLMFPSAAGAVGAVGALAIGIVRQRLNFRQMWEALSEAASTTAVLFLIIIGGLLFSRLLLASGFITDLTDLITSMGLTKYTFMALVLILYLIMGCLVDTISMLVMTVPFLAPVADKLGIDPIWFGIIIVKLAEIGAITPPVGMNLFAVLAASEGRVSSRQLFVGVVPFLMIEAVTLGLLLTFPEIVLWLPGAMR